jgi:hypothetical protein
MRRYLVVANQTLAGRHLLDHVRRCVAAEPCWFHVLVPATPVERQVEPPIADAPLLARRRLAAALARFGAEGVTATGEVGDANPLRAVANALQHLQFDEIILSTLPAGTSQWLLEDLPTRLAASTGLRVTHVVTSAHLPADTTPLNA